MHDLLVGWRTAHHVGTDTKMSAAPRRPRAAGNESLRNLYLHVFTTTAHFKRKTLFNHYDFSKDQISVADSDTTVEMVFITKQSVKQLSRVSVGVLRPLWLWQ